MLCYIAHDYVMLYNTCYITHVMLYVMKHMSCYVI